MRPGVFRVGWPRLIDLSPLYSDTDISLLFDNVLRGREEALNRWFKNWKFCFRLLLRDQNSHGIPMKFAFGKLGSNLNLAKEVSQSLLRKLSGISALASAVWSEEGCR